MAHHGYVFLLMVCLLLSLALLWRLDWFPLRPSSSRGEAKHSTLQRLLKPRCPDDCPACRLCIGYIGHPFEKETLWASIILLYWLLEISVPKQAGKELCGKPCP